MGTLITYATIFGTWPTTAELDERLRRLNRTDVILRLAWCNAYIEGWKRIRSNKADEQIRNAWFPFWNGVFRDWSRHHGEGFLFARQTILWLIKRAFVTCSIEGEHVANSDTLRTFGEACLIANDLSAFETPKKLPGDLDVAANLLPNMEYASFEDYDREISRTLYLLTDLAPNAVGTRLPEFARRIQELIGYEVTEYCDLVLATAITPVAHRADVNHFQLQALHPEHFRTTAIPPETAERFLQSIAESEPGFAERIATAQVQPFDFTIFRETPLLLHEGAFVTLDSSFTLDKAGKSLFWTALKSAPTPDERNQLLIDFGGLFETYVNEVLIRSIPAHCRMLPDVRFGDGAQAFDAAILEGSALIVFEHKASTIRNTVKYADNPAKFGEVLESRFVTGEGANRKGVRQLWNGVNRFTQGESLYGGGREVRIQEVNEILPVLVHLDNALRTIGIPHYMAERFRAFGRFKRHTVTPLVLLPITELEDLEGHLQERGLATFLRSFLTELRRNRAAVFLTSHLPILHGNQRRVGPTLELFDRYFDEMMARLFPDVDRDRT
jgi:hypothetical protein